LQKHQREVLKDFCIRRNSSSAYLIGTGFTPTHFMGRFLPPLPSGRQGGKKQGINVQYMRAIF